MKILFFRLALICIFSLSAQSKSLTLKIVKNVGALVIVEVPLGQNKAQFLIDSGSNATFIDPTSIAKLGDSIKRDKGLDKTVNTFSGKKKSLGYRLTLRLDMFQYLGLESYAMNTKKFKKKLDGIDCCDGILGANFLKKYPVEINLLKKQVTIHQTSKQVSKGFNSLPISIRGKDTIVVSCKVAKKNFDIRLDSGNEVPIVFQKRGIAKFRLQSSIDQAGFKGVGLPFFKLNSLECGKHKFEDLSSTFYLTNSGALAHGSIDANVGAHLLGDHYIFDLSSEQIYFKNSYNAVSKTIKSLKHYEVNLADIDNTVGHISILDQALYLILNSCQQIDSNSECLNYLCLLEGDNCAYGKDVSLIQGFYDFKYQKKSRKCGPRQLISELQSNPLNFNYCWYKLYEENKVEDEAMSKLILPSRLKAIKTLENLNVYQVKSLKEFVQDYYCFYVYKKVINPKTLTPQYFPLSIKGGSYLKHEAQAYLDWSSSDEFKGCSDILYKALGVKASKNIITKDLIYINTFTVIGDGVKKFKDNVDTVLNHESLHILYAKDKNMKKKAQDMWNALSAKEKDNFKKKHSSYDFSSLSTAYKEYFSYYYESRLDELL